MQRLLVNSLLLMLMLVSPAFAAQTRDTFDHLTTGFELLGQHRDLPCESCHANAVFKGTPRDCGACHGIGTAIRATAKTANHVLSTDRCDACHTPVAWSPAVNFDHAESLGSCSTCHNNSPGAVAQGKPSTHIQTNLECDACHSTISWAGAVFNHAGITGNCASCHNGVEATGMPATHIPIGSAPCEACHSPTNFATFAGTVMNHAAVAGMPCEACHEAGMSWFGVNIVTRPPAPHPTTGDCSLCHGSTTSFTADSLRPANHIPTTATCAQCHTTPNNYAVYSVTGTHIGVTECVSCHGPAVANTFANVDITTTTPNHIPIGSLDCNGAGCHTTTDVNAGGFSLGTASVSAPTLNVAGHNTVAAAVAACQTCHETAPYQGMLPSSASTPADSRPTAFDKGHPTTGDCGGCHTTTPTFSSNVASSAKPANHIPTSAPCTQCHTTAGNYAAYSVTGTHQGVTSCITCHAPAVATTFANVTITTTPANHIPIGSLDCNGAGCHTTTNLNPGGFTLGAANISNPTLNVTGHTTVAATVAACQTCHESAPYLGMLPSSGTTAADSRPPTALDAGHPPTGDCGGCHVTSPTFASNVVSGTKPANHIPTIAACTQCHTTPGNFAVYSVTGTHQGVTSCLICHAPTVAATFANITIATTPSNHFPIGTLDCNGSGCHTTANVTPGGFTLGSANISSPTLNVTGHTTIAAAVAACGTCHETAPFLGMVASSATAAGDSRPTALDKSHPTTGDCGGCHTTTPTFGSNETGGSAKPANHIPTSAPCAQCHTTAGNYASYSVTGTHQGVTNCLTCHAPAVATTFANITIVTTPSGHIPVGTLDCNGAGCHTTTNVNPGGFVLGTANISSPTLNTTGHTTVGTVVSGCQTCHETAPYQGMVASTATAAGDSRPTALDKSHPTSGDCGGCHTTTPTFASNLTSASKPSNHIPTNAPCTQCHTTPGNYAAYVMGATGHTGITSNCAQCHADGLSFANMTPPTLVEPPTGATGHIPVGSFACELCHSVTNFATFSGTIMKHSVVRANACDSCHEYGMTWKTNSGVKLWTRPSPNHHAGQDCGGSGCHTSQDKHQLRGGATLQAAKPADHIATTSSCQSCHTSLAWAPVKTVDHAQVIGTCFSCHSGKVAVGKPVLHIASSNACESCHTTNAWMPARFDHSAVGARTCSSCHNSLLAIGLPRNHISTTQQCGTCHGTLTWTPAKLDHSTLRTSCQTCHNNTNAVGKPVGHMVMQTDCATCHTYPDWSLVSRNGHMSSGVCATCHVKDFFAASHPKTAKGVLYSATELSNCSGSCHVYGDASLANITRRIPGPYHRASDAAFKH